MREEEYEKQVRVAREKERAVLHEELEKHQDNLNKIEQMSRALRYQYAELRRHHMALRAEVSANKMTLKEVSGDNLKGTEFDIAGPPPKEIEDLDSVPSVGLTAEIGKHVTETLNEQYQKNMQTLKTSHQRQRSTLGNFLVSNAAALGHSFPSSVLSKLNPTKKVSPSALRKLIDSFSAHSSRASPSRPRPPALSKAAAEKMITSALSKGDSGKHSSEALASVSLSAALMKALSSSSSSDAHASSHSAAHASSSSPSGAAGSSAGYLKQEEVDTLLKLLEELLEHVKKDRASGSHGSGKKVDPSKLKARVDQLTDKNFKKLEAKFKAWVNKLPAEMKEAKVMTAEALKEQKEKLKRKAREQAEKEVEKEIKSGKLK